MKLIEKYLERLSSAGYCGKLADVSNSGMRTIEFRSEEDDCMLFVNQEQPRYFHLMSVLGRLNGDRERRKAIFLSNEMNFIWKLAKITILSNGFGAVNVESFLVIPDDLEYVLRLRSYSLKALSGTGRSGGMWMIPPSCRTDGITSFLAYRDALYVEYARLGMFLRKATIATIPGLRPSIEPCITAGH